MWLISGLCKSSSSAVQVICYNLIIVFNQTSYIMQIYSLQFSGTKLPFPMLGFGHPPNTFNSW